MLSEALTHPSPCFMRRLSLCHKSWISEKIGVTARIISVLVNAEAARLSTERCIISQSAREAFEQCLAAQTDACAVQALRSLRALG